MPKFSSAKPPIYQQCVDKFGINWHKGIIFTYGDTIHSKNPISKQKIAHESVHIRQQAVYGVNDWWNKYFEDEGFRLDQETEAYRQEAKWIRANVRDKNKASSLKTQLARDLSSSMYGKIISYAQAVVNIG